MLLGVAGPVDKPDASPVLCLECHGDMAHGSLEFPYGKRNDGANCQRRMRWSECAREKYYTLQLQQCLPRPMTVHVFGTRCSVLAWVWLLTRAPTADNDHCTGWRGRRVGVVSAHTTKQKAKRLPTVAVPTVVAQRARGIGATMKAKCSCLRVIVHGGRCPPTLAEDGLLGLLLSAAHRVHNLHGPQHARIT